MKSYGHASEGENVEKNITQVKGEGSPEEEMKGVEFEKTLVIPSVVVLEILIRVFIDVKPGNPNFSGYG